MELMEPWHVQHIRITMFSAQRDAVPAGQSNDLFATFAGSQPEIDEWRGNRTIHRRLGNRGQNRMELLEQPFRADVSLLGPQNLELVGFQADLLECVIGPISDLRTHRNLATDLAAVVVDPIRVAVGALLFIPENSPTESYSRLQMLIPHVNLDHNQVADFILQANRFKPSDSVPSQKINRISTFSSMAMGTFSPSLSGPNTAMQTSYYTQLVVDVNTDVTNQAVLDHTSVSSLFDELFDAIDFLAAGYT